MRCEAGRALGGSKPPLRNLDSAVSAARSAKPARQTRHRPHGGGSLDNAFYQGGYAGTYTGTIRLVPEPSTASLLALGLIGIAAVRRRH